MIDVRRFVKGTDEPTWVRVLNAAYREYESWWMGLTVEEMLEQEKRPGFDFEGRFIAELDGGPAGVVRAHVDELGEEKKGLIQPFCVMPDFRGRGVEKRLAETAMNELEKRGVNTIRTWIGSRRGDRIQLLEKLGFKPLYKTIDLETDLTSIPSDIGENTQVTIRTLQKNVEEDVKALNWLTNECFRGYPDYRPRTIDDTRDSLINHPYLKEQGNFFAVLGRKAVGYINVGIAEKYNAYWNAKSGRISGIGVLQTHRRKGIGTKLVLEGLRTLKAKGVSKAMLDTEDFNQQAIGLYEKVGFEVVQVYISYEKRLQPSTSSA